MKSKILGLLLGIIGFITVVHSYKKLQKIYIWYIIFIPDGQVAQSVEHAAENRSVGGSIPPLATSHFNSSYNSLILFLKTG